VEDTWEMPIRRRPEQHFSAREVLHRLDADGTGPVSPDHRQGEEHENPPEREDEAEPNGRAECNRQTDQRAVPAELGVAAAPPRQRRLRDVELPVVARRARHGSRGSEESHDLSIASPPGTCKLAPGLDE